jgi:hypothetical protein
MNKRSVERPKGDTDVDYLSKPWISSTYDKENQMQESNSFIIKTPIKDSISESIKDYEPNPIMSQLDIPTKKVTKIKKVNL